MLDLFFQRFSWRCGLISKLSICFRLQAERTSRIWFGQITSSFADGGKFSMEESRVLRDFFKSVVKSICNIFYHFLWVKTCSNTFLPLNNHDSGLSNLKQLISFLFSLNERNTRQRLLLWAVTLQLLLCFAHCLLHSKHVQYFVIFSTL